MRKIDPAKIITVIKPAKVKACPECDREALIIEGESCLRCQKQNKN